MTKPDKDKAIRGRYSWITFVVALCGIWLVFFVLITNADRLEKALFG